MRYLFYFHSTKTLVELPLSNDSAITIAVESFPFAYEGRTFDNYKGLVEFCGENNIRIKKEYKSKYHINPPYILDVFLDPLERCACNVIYHDCVVRLVDHGLRLTLHPNYGVYCLDKFFEQITTFCPIFLLGYHELIMKNMVFCPCIINNRLFFAVRENGYLVDYSRIEHGSLGYFLNSQKRNNNVVLKNYNVSSEEIEALLDGGNWRGNWPYSTEKVVYDIINYINRTRCSMAGYLKFDIKDDKVVSPIGEFYFKQNKNHKWFLAGDIDDIFKLFRVDSLSDLKKFINNILGEKRRPGVFPECDSKEELITIVKKLEEDE